MVKDYQYVDVDSLRINFSDDDEGTIEIILDAIEQFSDHFSKRPAQVTFVKDNTSKFIQIKAAEIGAQKTISLAKSGDLEGIHRLWKESLQVGLQQDWGMDYNTDDFETRHLDDDRFPIPTGIKALDEIMGGGLGVGEMGIVAAPGGAGKSWLLMKIGASAYMAGKTVVHYTLELSEKMCRRRYDSVISGMNKDEIRENPQEAKRRVHKASLNGGRLIVKRFIARKTSILDIRAHLDYLKINDIKVDEVILDYADLLNDAGGRTETRHALDAIYIDVRAGAQEMNIPWWTASQTNRSSVNELVITEEHLSEDFRKLAHADVLLTLSRGPWDRVFNYARLFLVKQRVDKDKILFPGVFDVSKGAGDFHLDMSDEGAELYKKMVKARDHYQKYKSMSDFAMLSHNGQADDIMDILNR